MRIFNKREEITEIYTLKNLMTSILHWVLLQRLNEKGWSQLNIKKVRKSVKGQFIVIILKLFTDHNKNYFYSFCKFIEVQT
jgi:hypothetical protein